MLVPIALAIALSYLIGSIAGGRVVGHFAGKVDVTSKGSGNVGTTNVLRVLGKKCALLVFLIDFFKGTAAVYLASMLVAGPHGPLVQAVSGLACICGHNWSLFFRFRGGKGVATSAGVFLFLAPVPLLLALGAMIAVVGTSRYVSLGSMMSAALLPVFIYFVGGASVYVIAALVVAALVIFRHRGNIVRLLQGSEHKLGTRSSAGRERS